MTKEEIALQLTMKMLEYKDFREELEYQVSKKMKDEKSNHLNSNLVRVQEILDIYHCFFNYLET